MTGANRSHEQYPEHEKLKALRIDPDDPFTGRNQLIGDFIEWLSAERIELAVWKRLCGRCESLSHEDAEACENEECGAPSRSLGRPRLWPAQERRDDLIGRFFGIDPRKLSEEKDQMLAELRTASKGK
jgi:hypothetical protein